MSTSSCSTPQQHEGVCHQSKLLSSSSSMRKRDRDSYNTTSPLSSSSYTSPSSIDQDPTIGAEINPTRLFPTISPHTASPRHQSKLRSVWRKADSFLGRTDMLTLCLGFIVINSVMTIFLITQLSTNVQDLRMPTTNEFPNNEYNRYGLHTSRSLQVNYNHEQMRGQSRARLESSTIMMDLGYEPRPKAFGFYFDSALTSQLTRRLPTRLPTHWENTMYDLYPSKRIYEQHTIDKQGIKYTQNSANYNDEDGERRTKLTPYAEAPECNPMHEWQTMTYPTCNSIHEKSMFDFSRKKNRYHTQLKLLANGYFRDTYQVRDSDGETSIALKTIRYKRRYDGWMYDRHRMDAVVMERMTKSPNIMDIYGFCGFSGLFEFADGGDVESFLDFDEGEERPSKLELLRLAVDMANGLADLHSIDSRNGFSSIAHADIYTSQYVFVNGKVKLNDFNRCNFMYWNTTSDKESCPYNWQDYNAGPFRSPEEYKYDLQSEKIDVYSFGNIIFLLLTGEEPFIKEVEELGNSAVMEDIGNGLRPLNKELVADIKKYHDPIDNIFVNAIKMCHVYDPVERAGASEVRDYLVDSLEALEREEKKRHHRHHN